MKNMNQEKIQVINYLDKHVKIDNQQVEKYSNSTLQEAFPDVDEFTLNSWKKKWRAARQGMLDIKI